MTTAENPESTKTFRILAADKIAEDGLEYLRSQPDAEVDNKPGLSEDELAAIAGEYDGMIVRSGVQVTDKVLANPGRLQAVARAGVGVDNIDLTAATNHGILVMNTAAANTLTTAEMAFALLLGAARNIGPAYRNMCEGGWDRSKFQGRQLAGKTLGIVGFGRIGQTLAERALAFDMKVIGYDPFWAERTAMDGRVKMVPSFRELIPHVDALSFHVPLNDETRGMLNRETFQECREGVLVVNASRGGVVDEDALVEAVESGRCYAAGLDVFEPEPPAEDSPLRNNPRILTTPHLGASTKEAQQAVSIDAARVMLNYLRGEGMEGAVNVSGVKMDLDPLQAAFADLSERMGRLMSPMVSERVDSVTFEITGEQIGSAAGTIERSALIGLLGDHLDPPLNMVNIRQIAEERGIRLRTVTEDEDVNEPAELAIEIKTGGETRRIVGRVYHDMRPRVVEVNGYHMDMIPAGPMVLLQNEDRPGMVGRVGEIFGSADVNIADMAISRHDHTALMVLKVDTAPPADLRQKLTKTDGVKRVFLVKLPAEPETDSA